MNIYGAHHSQQAYNTTLWGTEMTFPNIWWAVEYPTQTMSFPLVCTCILWQQKCNQTQGNLKDCFIYPFWVPHENNTNFRPCIISYSKTIPIFFAFTFYFEIILVSCRSCQKSKSSTYLFFYVASVHAVKYCLTLYYCWHVLNIQYHHLDNTGNGRKGLYPSGVLLT